MKKKIMNNYFKKIFKATCNYGKNYIADFTYIEKAIILVNFDKLSGMFVICAGGFDLGNVNGIEINTTNWQVTHLLIKLSKPASEDLGFKKRFRSSTVCVPTSLISQFGDNILLNKSLEELTRHSEISEWLE
jgi:sporulation protein YlmC with PRC-barrel domain